MGPPSSSFVSSYIQGEESTIAFIIFLIHDFVGVIILFVTIDTAFSGYVLP